MLSRLPGLILPGLSLAALILVGVLALRGDSSAGRPPFIRDPQGERPTTGDVPLARSRLDQFRHDGELLAASCELIHDKGDAMSYSDVQKAVRVEKFRIWFAWACGGFVGLGVANATKDIHIVSVITQMLFVGLGILSTIAAVRMTNALNRKAEAARKEVLGDL